MSNWPTTEEKRAIKADLWDALMEMCGHLQDSSEQTVTLMQDDATRTAIIKVEHGRNRVSRYFVERGSFEAAIGEYRKQHPLESEEL